MEAANDDRQARIDDLKRRVDERTRRVAQATTDAELLAVIEEGAAILAALERLLVEGEAEKARAAGRPILRRVITDTNGRTVIF